MNAAEIIRQAKARRRIASWLILLGLPVAIGGFVAAVVYEATISREQAGLVMLGGMIAAFIMIGAGLHIYRCPSCNKIPSRRLTSAHWRISLSANRCPKCGVALKQSAIDQESQIFEESLLD